MSQRPARLERSFRRRARRLQPVVAARFGDDQAGAISEEAIAAYCELVPEITRLGKGLLDGSLAGTYEYLAYAKVLRRRGVDSAEIGAFFDDSFRALASRFPAFLGPLLFRVAKPWLRRRLRREAAETQQAPTASGWVFEFVESERRGSKESGVDFGFDVTQCAVCALYSRHGESELVPYLCALDDRISEAMAMGLRRNGTRALGSSCCDFRYNAGGVPQPLGSQVALPVIDD